MSGWEWNFGDETIEKERDDEMEIYFFFFLFYTSEKKYLWRKIYTRHDVFEWMSGMSGWVEIKKGRRWWDGNANDGIKVYLTRGSLMSIPIFCKPWVISALVKGSAGLSLNTLASAICNSFV